MLLKIGTPLLDGFGGSRGRSGGFVGWFFGPPCGPTGACAEVRREEPERKPELERKSSVQSLPDRRELAQCQTWERVSFLRTPCVSWLQRDTRNTRHVAHFETYSLRCLFGVSSYPLPPTTTDYFSRGVERRVQSQITR